jgi:hypothetical protein
MSRRTQVVRSMANAGLATARPEEDVFYSNPAFASLIGDGAVTSGAPARVPAAQQWWQTPRLDSYVTVEAFQDGHAFKVLRECDLLVNLHVDCDLPADDTEPGYFRSIVHATPIGDSGGNIDYWTAGAYSVEPGPWKRSAFVSDDSVYYAGMNITRPFHFVEMSSGYLVYATIDNKMENSDLYYTWKLTVILLDTSTLRELPGGGVS